MRGVSVLPVVFKTVVMNNGGFMWSPKIRVMQM